MVASDTGFTDVIRSSLHSIEEDHVDDCSLFDDRMNFEISNSSLIEKPKLPLNHNHNVTPYADSTGSVNSLTSATMSLKSIDLLENLMQTHKNCDPYSYYTLLECMGKGSIGSVEKVVKKHIPAHSPKNLDSPDDKKSRIFFPFGGIFHDCCVSGDMKRNPNKYSLKTLLEVILPNLRSSDSFKTDAFLSMSSQPVASNSSRSVVSESSAFSAPPLHSVCNGSDYNRLDNFLMKQNDQRNYSLHSNLNNLHRNTRHSLRRYALKSIRLDRIEGTSFNGGSEPAVSLEDEAELRNEIAVLRSLDHPHIVHIIETFEYKRMIYLLLDLCEGGDLYVMDPYTECEAKVIVRQLCQAVSYMHRRSVVHRDLKYENVMFVERSDRIKLEIKLIDFGLSMKYGASKDRSSETIMTDFVGTIYTMAPEVICGKYTSKCDLWSIGVMTYMLLSSQIPFVGKDMSEIAKQIIRGNYSFSGKKWNKISKQGKAFIDCLLLRDASSRLNADQALKHPWLATVSGSKSPNYHRRNSSDCFSGANGVFKGSIPQSSLDSQIFTSIEKFSTYSWLHRLALLVIGYKFTGKETTYLREVFLSFDKNNTGTVETEELRQAFALHRKYCDEEIDQIFAALDMSGIGKITWTEFLAATIEAIGGVGEEEFAECFDRLDCDGSGYISTGNLQTILGDLPVNIFDKIIDESDITRDHKIWRHEFMSLLDEGQKCHKKNIKVPLQFVYKRSNSVDDVGIFEIGGMDVSREEDFCNFEDIRQDDFKKEKAKSIRKLVMFK